MIVKFCQMTWHANHLLKILDTHTTAKLFSHGMKACRYCIPFLLLHGTIAASTNFGFGTFAQPPQVFLHFVQGKRHFLLSKSSSCTWRRFYVCDRLDEFSCAHQRIFWNKKLSFMWLWNFVKWRDMQIICLKLLTLTRLQSCSPMEWKHLGTAGVAAPGATHELQYNAPCQVCSYQNSLLPTGV